MDEEIVYNFDDESPFSWPSIDVLMPRVREWLAASVENRAAYIIAEEGEVEADTPPRTPRPKRRAAAKATLSGDGQRPKRPTNASLAADMAGLMNSLPHISKPLAEISERQRALAARVPVPIAGAAPTLGQSFQSTLTVPPPPISVRVGTQFETTSHTGKAEPWFVGFPLRPQACGVGRTGGREAGGRSQVRPDFRRHISKGQRPPCRPVQFKFCGGDKRCSNTCTFAAGVGSRQGSLFPEYEPEDGTYQQSTCDGRGAFEPGHPGSEIPGTLRRIWEDKRPWPAAVSGDDDLRFSHGRELLGSNGWSCIACCDPGAGKFGWWTNGVSHLTLPPRRSSCEHFREQAVVINLEGALFRAPRRSEVGNVRITLPERDGDHCHKAQRDECRRTCSFRQYIRKCTVKGSSKSETKAAAKEEGPRKRPTGKSRGCRGR